jgi:hypothetical protein
VLHVWSLAVIEAQILSLQSVLMKTSYLYKCFIACAIWNASVKVSRYRTVLYIEEKMFKRSDHSVGSDAARFTELPGSSFGLAAQCSHSVTL